MQELKVVASAEISNLQKGMQDAQKSLAQTAAAANNLDSSLKKTVTGTNQAGNALQNLGRVAQDAPFGFIGIQNNLNPLLESFQRLKVETGSSSGALKALAGSLVGAGGLGLALSLVSSAIVIYQNGIAGFNSKTKEAVSAADQLSKAVSGIFADSGKEAANVLSLIAVIDTQNESYKRKADALKELQKIQPEYFGQLKLEGGIVVGLDAAYQNYIANFKNVIAAKVLQIKLETAVTKLLELQGTTVTAFIGKYKGLVDVQKQTGEAGQKVFEIQEKIRKSADTKISSQEGLIESIFKQLKNVSSGIKVPDFKVKEVKIKPEKITVEAEGVDVIMQGLLRNRSKDVKGNDIKISPIINFEPIIKKGIFESRLFDLNKLKEEAAKRAQAISGILQSTFSDAFASIGETIGNAISGGGDFFGNLFSGIFKALGSGLKQLGVYAITTSKLIIALKTTIGTSLGVLGGIALIALGTIISAAASKIQAPKFATGVRNFGGGTALVGERGPELVTLPRGAGVQTNGQLNALSSSNAFIMETVIRGNDLAVILKKTNATNSRNG